MPPNKPGHENFKNRIDLKVSIQILPTQFFLILGGVGQCRKAVFFSHVTSQCYSDLPETVEPKNRQYDFVVGLPLVDIVLQKSSGYAIRGYGYSLVRSMAVERDYLITYI